MGKGDGRRLLQPPCTPAMGGKTSCGNEGESKKGGGPDPALTDRLPGPESVQGTETSRLGLDKQTRWRLAGLTCNLGAGQKKGPWAAVAFPPAQQLSSA